MFFFYRITGIRKNLNHMIRNQWLYTYFLSTYFCTCVWHTVVQMQEKMPRNNQIIYFRFANPRPVRPWHDVKNVTGKPNSCVQIEGVGFPGHPGRTFITYFFTPLPSVLFKTAIHRLFALHMTHLYNFNEI